MTGQLVSPIAQIQTPSLGLPPQQIQNNRGICTLSFGGNTLQFRTNPNEITWDYSMITHIEETYGGRVIQILGVKMDNLRVKVDCGQGGWPYAMYVVQFIRDLMMTQRNGQPAHFSYTTRNWNLKVFAVNVPFHDAVEETVRELVLDFKIQQDISGVQTAASLQNALSALADGIGFIANSFSDGLGVAPNDASGGGAATALQSTQSPVLPTALTGPTDPGIPGFSNILGSFGGLFGL